MLPPGSRNWQLIYLMIRYSHLDHRSFAKSFANTNPGADYLAYPPVVAYGNNANTIHYTKNSAPFGDRSEVSPSKCAYIGKVVDENASYYRCRH